MLTRLIDWSLAHRWAVLLGTLALIVSGLLAFRELPIDATPDTTPTQVQVNTLAPALTPIEVERQLIIPVPSSRRWRACPTSTSCAPSPSSASPR